MNLFEQIGNMCHTHREYLGEYPTHLHLGKLTHDLLKRDVKNYMLVQDDPISGKPDTFMGMKIVVDYSKNIYLEVVCD